MAPRTWLFAIVTTGMAVTLSAQSVQTPQATFEVASIKKRDSPFQGFPRRIADHGTYSVPTTSVVGLIQFAYGVRDDLIVDGPDWIRTVFFEVNAKVGRDATANEMRPMMQSLLEERFGLVVRKEQREMRHLLLLPARADGRLGPNIRKTDSCGNSETRPIQPPLPPGAAMFAGCGTMATIAQGMSRPLRAPVIDRTGIGGTFHYYMHTSPEDMFVPLPGVPSPQSQNNSDASNLPSYRDALRDQLGLKTESFLGPIEILAIQSVHQPSEN